ncbi:RING-H2 finger protein ATL11-like [Gastrolobium bilobum]|uniref:RING-H2 finger protein ATL11-like n=1 Tax=Gastrolobium bilobum TaxID=150636 RepID=UPI002AB04922|nr:RING-H2 finger protein ATL11-like [Gastrolobium bilobum]
MSIHTESPAPAPTTPLTLAELPNFDYGRALFPLLFLFLFLFLVPPTMAQALPPSPPLPGPFARLRFDKTMGVVLVILVVVFFILGLISIYTRQCVERRIGGRFDLSIPIIGGSELRPPRGLGKAIIDTFPTFVYSEVKALKIGRTTLECAVCLNEFHDDETLRLLPKCSHVFHPDCIDVWLLTHSTCPVCRANLVPKPGDSFSSVAVQVPDHVRPDPESVNDPNVITRVDDDGPNRVITTESPRENLGDQSRPVRSRSTGFGIARLFPRSHSTGHSLVRPGEDCERFTLRLPEQVRNLLVNSATLNRTKSCGVTLQRESSGRRGYRTRSTGRSYMQYERFGGEVRPDRWGFTWTPPFLFRSGSTSSTKDANNARVVMEEVEVGECSSDCLFSKE